MIDELFHTVTLRPEKALEGFMTIGVAVFQFTTTEGVLEG